MGQGRTDYRLLLQALLPQSYETVSSLHNKQDLQSNSLDFVNQILGLAIIMNTVKSCLLVILLIQIVYGHPLRPNHHDTRFKRHVDVNIIQEKLIAALNPQPILDTIKESEKCCNLQQHPIGRFVSSTYDSVSQVVTNAFQFPKQKVNAIGKGVTDVLNQIGGKLVGLQ